uniref:Uncharacterized protein n=1 Tax=Knipowitschia caucasica TaxID=637954 RepID=A0AAV2KJG2_KNICA
MQSIFNLYTPTCRPSIGPDASVRHYRAVLPPSLQSSPCVSTDIRASLPEQILGFTTKQASVRLYPEHFPWRLYLRRVVSRKRLYRASESVRLYRAVRASLQSKAQSSASPTEHTGPCVRLLTQNRATLLSLSELSNRASVPSRLTESVRLY